MKDKLENILFIDVETVPQYKTYDDVPENIKELWAKKVHYRLKPEETPEQIYQQAGIWAEFGKIICIVAGFIYHKKDKNILRLKSFYGDKEKDILTEFCEALQNFETKHKNKTQLCAHNGKEFDFPYIARRLLINKLPIPPIFNFGGKKPWEVPFIDTMELWKFGDYKHSTSLNLMATIMGIETPKNDIDGSMVADVYYNENNINRIVEYCKKDVHTVAKLYLQLKGFYDFNLEISCGNAENESLD